jgi:hypothetical protein
LRLEDEMRRLRGLAHDELRRLKLLEDELAPPDEQISIDHPPHRNRMTRRVNFFAIVVTGIIAVALATAGSNMPISAFWRGSPAPGQQAADIEHLQSSIIEIEASQRQMAVSIAALQTGQEEIRGLLQNQQAGHFWYSYPPALHFRNPFPPRAEPGDR